MRRLLVLLSRHRCVLWGHSTHYTLHRQKLAQHAPIGCTGICAEYCRSYEAVSDQILHHHYLSRLKAQHWAQDLDISGGAAESHLQ